MDKTWQIPEENDLMNYKMPNLTRDYRNSSLNSDKVPFAQKMLKL